MEFSSCSRFSSSRSVVESILNSCFNDKSYDILIRCVRGVAQLGSAPLWGSGGRGFKSRRSDNYEDSRNFITGEQVSLTLLKMYFRKY